jgi:branched-chain amino acid transport system ATP-binding protein
MTILSLTNITATYGLTPVLFDVNLDVDSGECVALLGRNGMGKTTTVKVIMGQLPVQSGEISRFGKEGTAPDYAIARSGIGLVPEGRQIFPTLTVRENLNTFFRPAKTKEGWTFEKVLGLLPQLEERLNHTGNHLSGGEQQMLAIGRALMTNPQLLILDEATEGLAPIIREAIWSCLDEIRAQGQAILIIDKTLQALSRLADKFVIIEKGVTVWQGKPQSLLADEKLQSRYLSV